MSPLVVALLERHQRANSLRHLVEGRAVRASNPRFRSVREHPLLARRVACFPEDKLRRIVHFRRNRDECGGVYGRRNAIEDDDGTQRGTCMHNVQKRDDVLNDRDPNEAESDIQEFRSMRVRRRQQHRGHQVA